MKIKNATVCKNITLSSMNSKFLVVSDNTGLSFLIVIYRCINSVGARMQASMKSNIVAIIIPSTMGLTERSKPAK